GNRHAREGWQVLRERILLVMHHVGGRDRDHAHHCKRAPQRRIRAPDELDRSIHAELLAFASPPPWRAGGTFPRGGLHAGWFGCRLGWNARQDRAVRRLAAVQREAILEKITVLGQYVLRSCAVPSCHAKSLFRKRFFECEARGR